MRPGLAVRVDVVSAGGGRDLYGLLATPAPADGPGPGFGDVTHGDPVAGRRQQLAGDVRAIASAEEWPDDDVARWLGEGGAR